MTIARTLFAIAAAASLSACALNRTEISLPSETGMQPAAGVAVVVEAADDRRFELAPQDPSIPSLKEPGDVSNASITSRAVSRKRNGYGMAQGDVLLTPPQTVMSLIGDAVKAGLRDSGYRVLEQTDAGYAEAKKISVRIVEFWTWTTPGFAIKLDTSADLRLQGNLPQLGGGTTIKLHDNKGFALITDSDRQAMIAACLVQIRAKVRDLMAARTASAN